MPTGMVKRTLISEIMGTWIARDNYCYDCARYGLVRGFWGCKKFKCYKYEEFDRYCGGRFKIPRQKQY